ncbi:MAG: SUMF1/EgtB/PvdO family nonheme iron enzyme [Bacteroidales bacterium]|nr:SUMF1/EgtB/PvdO family nonheme iron enzyme [Bacteroidales bacterium]
MNRIILIGNGFDLAHGLQTSYGHFIDNFWKKQLDDVNDTTRWKKPKNPNDRYYTFENKFFSIRLAKKFVEQVKQGNNDDIFFEKVDTLKKSIEYYNNNFLESIENQYRRLQHWFDIEELYFRQLKNCKDRYKNDRDSYEIYTIKQLNKDFRDIKLALVEYLQYEAHKVTDDLGGAELHQKLLEFFIEKAKINNGTEQDITEIMFLSCNYIETETIYIENDKLKTKKIQIKPVHIHGIIDDTEKCEDNVIFGYGDESASESSDIENLNNNEFLENVKSIKYIVSPAYKELLNFMKKDDYDVFIFGHSCGNSDRTLLKELFEHERCKAIRYFFYTKKDGTNDFDEKTTNIYRAFGEKSKFREKMLEFNENDEFSSEKIKPNEGLRIGKEIEYDKKSMAIEGKVSENKIDINVIKKEETEQPAKVSQSIDGIIAQLTNGENLIKVNGGEFDMGSNDYDDEKPIHKVILDDFYMCRYQVTQKKWKEIMGNSPSWFSKEGGGKDKIKNLDEAELSNLPVECISWYDAIEFCNKLSKKYGLDEYYSIDEREITINFGAKGFRLPTEAEWEYAARGGNQSKKFKYSGSDNLKDVAWYYENSGDAELEGKWEYDKLEENNCRTHAVGTKQFNELGLYDMSGNVWEWCFDRYGSYDARSQKNPQGAFSGSSRVLRGGSWDGGAQSCRVSDRNYDAPGDRDNSIGFRLALGS